MLSIYMIEPSIHSLDKIALYGGFLISSKLQMRIISSALQACIFYGIVGLLSLNPT
jgi:hypothetical protein